MTKRIRPGISMSLFPFLTVLICTMGALIIMLVMAVHKARQQALEVSSQKTQEQEETLVEIGLQRDLSQVQFSGWHAKRSELVSEMSKVRQIRSHLTSEIELLQRRQAELGRQFEALNQESEQNVPIVNPESLADMRQQIDELSMELENKRSLIATTSQSVLYSVVPFFGPNATPRRPIYVECTAEAIVLQPMGVHLAAGDFPVDPENGNPLDAALTTIQKYWNDQQVAGQNSGAPYPLLIVRPDGSGAYALARRCMVNWTDEFGYELIESNIALEFGEADSRLRTLVEQAVENSKLEIVARNLQRQRIAAARTASSVQMGQKSGAYVATPELEPDTVNGGFRPRKNVAEAGNKDSSTHERNLNKTDTDASRENSAPTLPSSDTSGPLVASGAQDSMSGAVSGTNGVQLTCEPIAEAKGKNWAVPAIPGRTVALVRPIKVYCTDQQLVLLPDPGTSDERIVIAFDQRGTAQAIPSLVAEVHRKIDSWGPAIQSGYWKPVLELRVVPGGESRQMELEVLLKESGLDLKAQDL